MYDVLIIGAGPIGLACGIEAKKANLSYLIVEKGCLANAIYHYPINMTFFSTSDRLEIGGVPFISHGDKPTRREALDYYRRVAMSWKLSLKLYEKVTNIRSYTTIQEVHEITTERGTYTAKNLIIATGFYDLPKLMNVKGESLPKVLHYYNAETQETNKKGVYLAGVVCGGMETNKWFIENSIIHAEKIIKHLTS